MMRSMYSAVSGLKTHQIRMDVIGNNIANVNTEAFKASRVTFSEIIYQTTSKASGGNGATGIGGINAKQIGLGVTAGATSINITTAGAAETTGNPFDLKLTDSQTTNFFIVSDGESTFFTRSGSYYVDANGYLCMTSTGYMLMGWQVDPVTGEIKKNTVSPLQVMSPANQTSAPEATTKGYVSGILDKNDPNLTKSDEGYVMTMGFFDDLGYSYTAKFCVKEVNTGDAGADAGRYTISLDSIVDQNGNDIIAMANEGSNKDNPVSVDQLFSTGVVYHATDENGNQLYADANENHLTPVTIAGGEYFSYTTETGETILIPASDITTGINMYQGVPVTAVGAQEYYSYTTEEGETVFVSAEDVDIAENMYGDIPVTAVDEAAYYYYITEEGETVFVPAEEVNTEGNMYGDILVDVVEAGNYYFYTNADGEMVISEPTQLVYTDPEGNVLQGFYVSEEAPCYYYNVGGKNIIIQDPENDINFNEAKMLYGNSPVYKLEDGKNFYYKLTETDENGKETVQHIISQSHTEQYEIRFDTNEGTFISVGGSNGISNSVKLNMSRILSNYANPDGTKSNFKDIEIDFSNCLNLNNGGTSTMKTLKGDTTGDGTGRKLGALTGISVDPSGKIFGAYDNGNTVVLGQISVAQFSNASGLEKMGDNCYKTTLNSGDFDGIGLEISADGSSVTTGQLEMSNVDLSSQFTDMIITQRGFQANSRVITTSDSLLEELINLKR